MATIPLSRIQAADAMLSSIMHTLCIDKVTDSNIGQIQKTQAILARVNSDSYWRTHEGVGVFKKVSLARLVHIDPTAYSDAPAVVSQPELEPQPEPEQTADLVFPAASWRDSEGHPAHPLFNEVYETLMLEEYPYLYGPAGTGKTTVAKQIAEFLGIQFYSAQNVTDQYSLIGFVDANGQYQETEFYKAVAGGGVFLFDEMDASDGNALTVANSLLANGFCSFPKAGMVNKHDQCYFIGAGNTLGTGADERYAGRNVLDEATRNRFSPIEIGYTYEVDLACANGDKELVEFVNDLRKVLDEQCINCSVSPRNIKRFVKYIHSPRLAKTAMQRAFVGFLDKDNLAMVQNNMFGTNKYARMLRAI